jgi:magnesium transporter
VETEKPKKESFRILKELIDKGDVKKLQVFLEDITRSETARAIFRLSDDDQQKLWDLLGPKESADIIEDLDEEQAADIIEDLDEEQAADIIEELPSDQQADVLGAMDDEDDMEAILQEMDPEEAKDIRQLLSYDEDSAGGVMLTEYVSCSDKLKAEDLLSYLRKNMEEFYSADVLYGYVLNAKGILSGVIKLRDLLFCKPTATLKSLMMKDPVSIRVDADLDELSEVFDKHDFFSVPVVDKKGRLIGVVREIDVNEALEKRAEQTYMKASGIIAGEEFRNMPMAQRSFRRLSVLTINIGLNILAASVIAAHLDTIQSVIALAVFLTMISDLSGCAGNQAVAVSIRELSLGLVKPHELALVLFKELRVGIMNGLLLGLLLGVVAFLWKGNPYLGVVIGGSLSMTVIISVCVGGMLPLVLKRLNIDPAIASSPILTTVTDISGFFLVLSFATLMLSKLSI